MMTVGELRERIKDLPDDAPILISIPRTDQWVGVMVGKRAVSFPDWQRYQTKEVGNAYQANDDRYDQSSVLLIEVGDNSP